MRCQVLGTTTSGLGNDFNPGVVLYALFLTWYVVDYFVFERVQLYTYDVIHENLGFKMFWGGIVVFGWVFILPLWGMAAYPSPGCCRHSGRTFC